ncbi:hypothetical protein ABFT51_17745 [Paenibacillus peoriae]
MERNTEYLAAAISYETCPLGNPHTTDEFVRREHRRTLRGFYARR